MAVRCKVIGLENLYKEGHRCFMVDLQSYRVLRDMWCLVTLL